MGLITVPLYNFHGENRNFNLPSPTTDVTLRPGVCIKYFLSFSQKKPVTRKNRDNKTNQVFTLEFFNDEIDQNTNFAKLPQAKCHSFFTFSSTNAVGKWHVCKI